ncbi:uncharacterized protein LOC132703876 [Cylas formicarius]|uniref:uncharacterized protein LOC132703876 n=1 Tax=Cylas formicarius TaxID=197179 RepID=UPI0029586BF7|nr:uncharacterized protein LOC132703876 [Cylas formicarius]
MFKAVLLFVSLLLPYTRAVDDVNILCLSSTCSDAECGTLPKNCQIQNATHNGIFLPSPDICNCCDYCLANIEEGGACTVGDPSSGQHTSICGPLLSCVPKNDNATDGKCRKMTTDCTLQQLDYDERRQNGSLGTMEVRAKCDEDGLFDSFKCIPGQTCYCLHRNGTRIFGQGDFSSIDSYMPCECSRKYYAAMDLMGRELRPSEHFRCDSAGNYDRVQCIGEKCLCVDALDGAPTYPDQALVNMTLISNNTLPCYTANEPGKYYKKCEAEYIEILNKAQKLQKSGYNAVVGVRYPKCDLDGSYLPVQENKTHKVCVDKDGVVLLTIDKSEEASLAANMDCKCARSLLVMSTNEKPSCLKNGNYNPIQCRRGICRCVDLDGNQVCSDASTQCLEVDESAVETLPCYVGT